MARPKKTGLDFFQDIKIRKLIRSQGGKAVAIYALLLCSIYKSGYYVRWEEELPFIISENTGYEEVYISEVIKYCVRVGLFDATLFERERVLTSRGIQERYFEIAKRRVEAFKYPFLLVSVTETPISATETRVSAAETPISVTETHVSATESTQKKRKENKKEKNKIKKEKIDDVVAAEESVKIEKIVVDFMDKHHKSLEAFCMQNHISRKEFGDLMLELLTEWELVGWKPSQIKKGRGDYESFHFLNTMRIKISENKKKQKANETKQTDRLQQRRGIDSTAQSRESFNGTL